MPSDQKIHGSDVHAVAGRTMTGTPITFSQLKAVINGMDESAWGEAGVFCGGRAVVDLSVIFGLPACDNRFHGKQEATKTRVEIEVAPPEKPFLLTVMDYSAVGGPMWKPISTPTIKKTRVASPEAALAYLKREFPNGNYPPKLKVGETVDCRCYGVKLERLEEIGA